MDIQQLIYFTTIAKTGTYVAAARQLFISQPALSKSIKRLENELNTHLFIQIEKKLELTDTGKLLFQKAVPFVENYYEILDTMNEASMQKKGYLRLGIPYGLGRILFDGLIADFSMAYPDIVIDLCGHGSQHVKELVSEGKIEIGACIEPPAITENFDITPLMHDRYFLLVNKKHPLAKKDSVSYADLCNELFYMLSDEYTMTRVTKANCAKAGFDPVIKLIENNPLLSVLDLQDGENDFDIVMITRKNTYLSYAAKYFLNFCKQKAADLDNSRNHSQYFPGQLYTL